MYVVVGYDSSCCCMYMNCMCLCVIYNKLMLITVTLYAQYFQLNRIGAYGFVLILQLYRLLQFMDEVAANEFLKDNFLFYKKDSYHRFKNDFYGACNNYKPFAV